MAALTQHSQKAIMDMISEMTRPISEILGESPLTPLEPRPRKRRLPIPLRSQESTSDADIMAITRSYKGPEPFLQGGRVSGDLGPTRKRPRFDRTSDDSVGKKRRREEKPPRPENGTKKREGDTIKRPRTEEVKHRPVGIKLTSQPANVKLTSQPASVKLTSQPAPPREKSHEAEKKSRPSLGNAGRKKEESIKELKKEAKKHVKKELDVEINKPAETKETPRKRRSPVIRIPASVVPQSQPRPLKSTSPEESGSDADRYKAKTKKKESAQKLLSTPRVPASENTERHRRNEKTRDSANDSPDRSASSSERRRPRSRQPNIESVHNRDREYGTGRNVERRDKGRNRERDRDRDSDRERSDKGRDSIRRSSVPADRDIEKNREHKKDRRDRDGERDREREDGKRSDNIDRVPSDRSKYRARDSDRDRERPSLRSSQPSSRPDSGRESSSAGHSPGNSRAVPFSSRPVIRSGSSLSPSKESMTDRSTRPQNGRVELKQNLEKQKELERLFKSTLSKIEELLKKRDYDGYEEAAKQGFRLSFALGLAMETELRLGASTFRGMDTHERSARIRPIIDHYKSLTKSYAPKRMAELEKIGRKEGFAFYKRGTQKVYFRMFLVHNLWNKDVQHNNTGLQRLLKDTLSARNPRTSNSSAEEEMPLRKLKQLDRLVHEHINILSILESILADFGSGFEEAGAEGYVP